MRMSAFFGVFCIVLITAPCQGEIVEITVTGTVEYNQVGDPPLGNVNSGDPATLVFQVDSTVFTNGPNFPTRGYDIDPTSFVLTLGSETFGLQDPFPPGETPYFVIRNDDPAVDGFLVSTNVENPVGVPINQTGVFGQFLNSYRVTYNGTVLTTLDILDAVGAYDFTDLTVFNWTIDDGPFNPVGLIFADMTIGVIPVELMAFTVE